MVMSEYYDKQSLINRLDEFITESDKSRIDWDSVIEDGEVYHGLINGVTDSYIYEIKAPSCNMVVIMHPMICTEIWFDHVQSKEQYMRGEAII